MKFLFGILPLARTPVPERVGQSQVFVECGGTNRCARCGLVERLECNSALLFLWMWPHWNRLVRESRIANAKMEPQGEEKPLLRETA